MKNLANAVGAKTARACDSCVKKRARWYCAADDAFLCQSCDTLVHSANPLARRHERVRLKSASPVATKYSSHNHSASSPPLEAATWHQGFTRKPRTPRGSGKKNNLSIFHDLVPEISAEDQTDSYEIEELLICQVPVLDPMVAEQFLNDVIEPKIEFPMITIDDQEDEDNAESCLNGFFPTDMELEEFAADVEILLAMNMGIGCGEDRGDGDGTVKEEEQKNVLMLSLNYESVISTWGGQGQPWMSGEPPERDIDISDKPVVSMEINGGESHHKHYVGGCLPSSGFGDGGREARVSRYREKRRTRLFSKKIRYEVRKLNAEKRPRMKGRFVKRASLALSAASSPLGVNY
ncbi:BnaC05g50730D [Brassica napus]|uniref:BnaC05g50730D protein n=1 Tax=Brassica napus TaxID=3708 RepID=A0A078JII7_BRANA|nr:BnaC05g50730D [Brassica napus]